MNLNEFCILNFLLNPDEIQDLNEILKKNIEEIETKLKMNNSVM